MASTGPCAASRFRIMRAGGPTMTGWAARSLRGQRVSGTLGRFWANPISACALPLCVLMFSSRGGRSGAPIDIFAWPGKWRRASARLHWFGLTDRVDLDLLITMRGTCGRSDPPALSGSDPRLGPEPRADHPAPRHAPTAAGGMSTVTAEAEHCVAAALSANARWAREFQRGCLMAGSWFQVPGAARLCRQPPETADFRP